MRRDYKIRKLLIIKLFVIIITFSLFCGCTENMPPPKNNDNESDRNSNFTPPPIDTSQPAAQNPITGETKTLTLGNLEITYYNKVYSNMIYFLGGDLFIDVENKGSNSEIIYSDTTGEIPSWNMHFFSFQNNTNIIQPDSTKKYHYFCSLDEQGQFDLNFNFWQKNDKSDMVTATVTFYSENGKIDFPANAQIYGTVYDKKSGEIIEGVEVICSYYTGRETAWRENTREKGEYFLNVPSTDDVKHFFGKQEFAYESMNHFVYVEHEGYKYYYKDDINLKPGDQYKLDIYLEPIQQKMEYSIDWEEKVEDYYGFFWITVDDSWKNCFATQAKHPPELIHENGQYYQTNIYLFNVTTGTQKWSYPTLSECWGCDITSDGKICAAGSHDQNVYVINSDDGTLKWSGNSGGMNREVEFSNDDTLLLSGPAQISEEKYDFALYKVTDGILQQGFNYGDWFRNSRFTYDDEQFVVGMGGGNLAMFDTQTGDMIWESWIGEFPLFLEIDDEKNTYATGKGRTLFSYDIKGDLRWSIRIPDHTITSGAISDDGSYLVLGSVGSWIYFIDTEDGEINWRIKQTAHSTTTDEEINTVGHNAVSISKNNKFIVVGGGPANHLTILDSEGTKIFEHTSNLNSDPILNDKWKSIGQGASEGTQKGIMCTVISDEGDRVIAGYGDNYIRSFIRN